MKPGLHVIQRHWKGTIW